MQTLEITRICEDRTIKRSGLALSEHYLQIMIFFFVRINNVCV